MHLSVRNVTNRLQLCFNGAGQQLLADISRMLALLGLTLAGGKCRKLDVVPNNGRYSVSLFGTSYQRITGFVNEIR